MGVLTLSVRDETTAGNVLADLELQLTSATLTVAELIGERVHQEVRRHNAAAATGERRFCGLVQPDVIERELNTTSGTSGRLIDADRQTDVTVDATWPVGRYEPQPGPGRRQRRVASHRTIRRTGPSGYHQRRRQIQSVSAMFQLVARWHITR